MPPVLRACIPFVLCVLVACSPSQTPNDAPKLAAAPQPPAKAVSQPPALAAIDPKEEKCTTEPRTDESDKRPRCGGMSGAPAVSHAYRIQLDNGESFTACDITQPFSGKIGRGMITMKYTPTDNKTGKVDWHFAGGGGMADTAYTYTLSGPENEMTATYTATAAVTGHGSGLTVQAKAVHQTFTSKWIRIEPCKAAP